jgi:hypothetical protein
MPASRAQLLGERTERSAGEYLQGQGLTIPARNYRRRRSQVNWLRHAFEA